MSLIRWFACIGVAAMGYTIAINLVGLGIISPYDYGYSCQLSKAVYAGVLLVLFMFCASAEYK